MIEKLENGAVRINAIGLPEFLKEVLSVENLSGLMLSDKSEHYAQRESWNEYRVTLIPEVAAKAPHPLSKEGRALREAKLEQKDAA